MNDIDGIYIMRTGKMAAVVVKRAQRVPASSFCCFIFLSRMFFLALAVKVNKQLNQLYVYNTYAIYTYIKNIQNFSFFKMQKMKKSEFDSSKYIRIEQLGGT